MCLVGGCSVLVHCSDGWDRTSQLCALAQLIVDPYYRTLKGFSVLIEKDFISFGHKFAKRSGRRTKRKESQESPIFLQFLDCVYQMKEQNRNAFEFNLFFLEFLAFHTDSGIYGNFLFDSAVERDQNEANELTYSIWSDVNKNWELFIDESFEESGILTVDYAIYELKLWKCVHLKYNLEETVKWKKRKLILE